jgi:flagellar basal body rod protein FlgG
MKLMNESEQPITFNSDDMMSNLCVSSDGQVKIEDRSTSPSTVNSYGFLQLALVRDPQRLTRLSGNYFIDADGSAGSMDAPAGTFKCARWLRRLHSSPLKEMNSMIQSVREYEMQAKIVKATTEIYKQETSKLSS